MPRSRRGSYPVRASQRRTGWEDGTGSTSPSAISGSTAGFVGLALAALVDGLTLVRTRGSINALLLTASAAGDGFQGAFGIGLATAAAVAVGILAVPTPITEQDWEGWLFWHTVSVHAGDRTAGDSNWNQATQRIEIDSKAMRKLGSDMALYAAFEVVEEGTATMEIWHDSRMLFKLP